MTQKQEITSQWFKKLRDDICLEFEKIEIEFDHYNPGKFTRKKWDRADALADKSVDGGSGEISMMKGNVFEKVGVNYSKVYGEFSEEFRKQIPGAEQDPRFWASGISLVAHMKSPLVPAVHMNTRFICTTKEWFGGGSDLNPMYEVDEDTKDFHQAFKGACDKSDDSYYPAFKKWCDEYFFIKHRNVARGVGGIFYDYLDAEFDKNFAFTKDVGLAFLDIFPKLVRRNMHKSWTDEQRQHQLRKRGLYAEFNLVYDRGTKFGLMTGGNTEAILMSLPPVAKWD
ncbi:MAG: oxygen-dependent coproporphyrinogen oxidase [Rickettsiales bacterium]|nr:oxygen-dependent coproporphyrinogen oxidase [Rickettsiales bacterium]